MQGIPPQKRDIPVIQGYYRQISASHQIQRKTDTGGQQILCCNHKLYSADLYIKKTVCSNLRISMIRQTDERKLFVNIVHYLSD